MSACHDIQLQVTKTDRICNHTWRVSDVLQFGVSAQHPVLLNGHCGRPSRHRSINQSKLCDCIPAPRIKALCSASPVDNATSACTQDVCLNKCVCVCVCVLASLDNRSPRAEQTTRPIGIHMHLQQRLRRLTWLRQPASLVLRQVSTQRLEF